MDAEKITTPEWFEFGDYFEKGKEFWIQSRILCSFLSRLRPGRVYCTEIGWAALANANALIRSLVDETSLPWEKEHKTRSRLIDEWTESPLTIRDWTAGHLIYGMVRGISPYENGNEREIAKYCLIYVDEILKQLGEDGEQEILPDSEFGQHYGPGSLYRRAVLVLSESLQFVPHTISNPRHIVAEAIARTKAIEKILGGSYSTNWLVRKTIPWIASHVRIGSSSPENLASKILDISVALEKQPEMESSHQEWMVLQIILGIIQGLDSLNDASPQEIVCSAALAATSLDNLNKNCFYSPLSISTHNWLSTMLLSQLSRYCFPWESDEEVEETANTAALQAEGFAGILSRREYQLEKEAKRTES